MNFKNIRNYNVNNKTRYIRYQKLNKNMSKEEIVRRVNLNLDYNFYENIHNALNIDTNIVLVNKYYKLGKEYVPKNLIKIDYEFTSRLDIYGDKEAVTNFKKMSIDASLLNLTIKTISVYRSYEYQEKLYNDYLINDEMADTYSARPGHSEHQTGLAFDVYNEKLPYTEFGNTLEYKWLKNNSYKYGFIIRYTKDNEYITGYKDEPWHIRYVGIKTAKYIYENDITLEEFVLNKR